MAETPHKDLDAIGQEILCAARNELYLNLPYPDAVLCALDFQRGGGATLSLATDGETLLMMARPGGALSPLPGGHGPGLSPCDPPLYAAPPGQKAGQGAGAVGSEL